MKIGVTNKIAIAILIALGLLVYANTLRNGMFWDDNDFILQNQYVRHFEVGKFFSENVIAGAGFVSNYWRPALLTVFSAEWHLFHGWTAGYHFVNMAIHIADAVLLFYILSSLPRRGEGPEGGRGRWLAFATSAIFLVHPLATEAVTYANSLGDSLSVFFMFAGILLFLKGRRLWPMLFYTLALMSKETAIIMPALLFLVVFFSPSRREGGDQEGVRVRSILTKIWPYLALAAIYVGLRATTLNFQNSFNLYNEQNIFTQSILVRILTFFRILTEYFGLMFWPAHLHMERSVALATHLNSLSVLVGAAIFVLTLTLAILLWRKARPVSFGLFWFLVGIAPTSNIAVPINGLLYEHWLYLPLIGIFLAVLWAGAWLAEKLNLKAAALGLICVVVAAFAVRSMIRNTDWHDPIRFYTKTLAYAPDSYRLWNNLGMAYADVPSYHEAENAYQHAISLRPGDAVAIYNLANTFRDTGKTEQAIEYYNRALTADPNFTYSLNALLALYLREKRFHAARKLMEQYYPDSLEKTQYIEKLKEAEQEQLKAK